MGSFTLSPKVSTFTTAALLVSPTAKGLWEGNKLPLHCISLWPAESAPQKHGPHTDPKSVSQGLLVP